MNPNKKRTMQEEELTACTANEMAEEQMQGQPEGEAPECSTEETQEMQPDEQEMRLKEQEDKYLRLAAEFDNYRKRTLKEKSELILNGSEKSIESILPVIDDLERAIATMETATDVEAVKKGVELIYHKFISILGRNGVKVIETKDMPLNTDLHEAVALIPAPSEAEKGKIVDSVQTGYTLNGKVLRHAKVVVGE